MVEAFFDRKKIGGAVYRREEIAAGSRLRVPCIVTEYSATTLIPSGCRAQVDSLGNIIIVAGQTGQ
jgi:N-methylhydantoinase A